MIARSFDYFHCNWLLHHLSFRYREFYSIESIPNDYEDWKNYQALKMTAKSKIRFNFFSPKICWIQRSFLKKINRNNFTKSSDRSSYK